MTAIAHSAKLDIRLPIKHQILIGLGLCSFFGLGQMFFPIWLLLLLLAGGAMFSEILRSAKYSLYVFMLCCVGLGLRTSTTRVTDGVDILAGIVIGGIFMFWVARLLLLEKQELTHDTALKLFIAFLCWAALAGFGGILYWNNTVNDWLREILIYCPALLMPMLYSQSIERDSKAEKQLFIISMVVLAALMVGTILKFRSNVVSAAYAWQMGRAMLDPTGSILMLYITLTFSMLTENRRRHLWWQIPVALLGFSGLALSSFRTLWAACLVALPMIFLLASKQERRGGYRFSLLLCAIILGSGTIAFFTVPLVQLYLTMMWERFASTTALKTDPSLVNRYIETAELLKYAYVSPLTGYGLGARFVTFDWLLGTYYYVGFAHNGFAFILFKSGVVGFILIYGSYAAFVIKSIQIARRSTDPITRAIARASTAFLLAMIVSNWALNIYGARSGQMWIGLIWGFLISRSAEIARPPKPALVSPPPSTLAA